MPKPPLLSITWGAEKNSRAVIKALIEGEGDGRLGKERLYMMLEFVRCVSAIIRPAAVTKAGLTSSGCLMSPTHLWRPQGAPHLVAVLSCLLSLSVACGDEADQAEKDAKSANNKVVKPTDQRARDKNLKRDGLSVKTFDLNNDQKPDQWELARDAAVRERAERDLNFDGQVDVWQYFDKAGLLIEEEMDLDFDGRVDMVSFYNPEGLLIRKELSLDFGGKFTVYKYYDAQGELLRIEQDEDEDGKIDRWDFYENKRRVRIGWDENSDGVPDRFDDLPG